MITQKKILLPIKLLFFICLSKIKKWKKLITQLWVLFNLFLPNISFLYYHRLKLQKQLFLYTIKALLIKILPLYIKILKAKNLILAIFTFLNIKFKYLNLKKMQKAG